MTESYFNEIESVEGVNGVKAQNVSPSDDPLVARIHLAMSEIGDAETSRKAEEAVLDQLIQSKLIDEGDPFIAMMNAMLIVIPQLMKCKEELLVEKTANYDYISSLNAYMAETQQHFSFSGDKEAPTPNGNYQSGNTTYYDDSGRVRGFGAAKAYMDNLSEIRTEKLFGGLAPDVQGIMNEAVKTSMNLYGYAPDMGKWPNNGSVKTGYDLPEILWQGFNGPEWIMEGGTDRYTNKNYGWVSGENKDLFNGNQRTAASYLTGQLSPVLDDAVTQNAIMENTLNGYSKQIESSYKFEMENYNSIVNTDAQMYQAQVNQNKAHTKRLRAI